jgi:hypothetical protein
MTHGDTLDFEVTGGRKPFKPTFLFGPGGIAAADYKNFDGKGTYEQFSYSSAPCSSAFNPPSGPVPPTVPTDVPSYCLSKNTQNMYCSGSSYSSWGWGSSWGNNNDACCNFKSQIQNYQESNLVYELALQGKQWMSGATPYCKQQLNVNSLPNNCQNYIEKLEGLEPGWCGNNFDSYAKIVEPASTYVSGQQFSWWQHNYNQSNTVGNWQYNKSYYGNTESWTWLQTCTSSNNYNSSWGNSSWGSSGWGSSTTTCSGSATEPMPPSHLGTAQVDFKDGRFPAQKASLKVTVNPGLDAAGAGAIWNMQNYWWSGGSRGNRYPEYVPNRGTMAIYASGGIPPYKVRVGAGAGGRVSNLGYGNTANTQMFGTWTQAGTYHAPQGYGYWDVVEVLDSWDPPHVMGFYVSVYDNNPVNVVRTGGGVWESEGKIAPGASGSISVSGGSGGG